MGGRIDTILMCVKFGDDRISSLDFSFIGGCTLKIKSGLWIVKIVNSKKEKLSLQEICIWCSPII